MIWTRAWWKGAGERALKTFLQNWVGVFGLATGAEVVTDLPGFLALPWVPATMTATVVTILSFATSVGNAEFTAGHDRPSDPGLGRALGSDH